MADENSVPVELTDDEVEQVAGGGDTAGSSEKKRGKAQQEFLTVVLSPVLVSG